MLSLYTEPGSNILANNPKSPYIAPVSTSWSISLSFDSPLSPNRGHYICPPIIPYLGFCSSRRLKANWLPRFACDRLCNMSSSNIHNSQSHVDRGDLAVFNCHSRKALMQNSYSCLCRILTPAWRGRGELGLNFGMIVCRRLWGSIPAFPTQP